MNNDAEKLAIDLVLEILNVDRIMQLAHVGSLGALADKAQKLLDELKKKDSHPQCQ